MRNQEAPVTLAEIIAIGQREQITPNGYRGCFNDSPDDWLARADWDWPAQVEACRRWLRQCPRNRRITPRNGSSYGFKHAVECWANYYVSNGAFLVACTLEGVTLQRCSPRSPNAWTNLKRSAMTRCLYRFGAPV